MGRLTVSRSRTAPVALLAALVAVLALTTGSSFAATKSIKARLVIEGNADAFRTVNLSGAIGLCEEQVEGRLEDETTYLRGRGVTLDISRRRRGGVWQYTMLRAGHGSAEFTVAAVRTRKASGTAELRDLPKLPGYCPKQHYDLAQTAGCGTHRITHNDVGLKIIGGTSFTVVASEHEKPESLPKPTCGETTLTDGFLGLFYEFPHFVEVSSVPLPLAALFGHAKAVVENLKGEVGNEHARPEVIKLPTLSGVALDWGKSDVTVRFIRCGAPHYPAC